MTCMPNILAKHANIRPQTPALRWKFINLMIKLINSFAGSLYGSSLWDPLSSEVEGLYKTWNVTLRNVFNLDRKTHRYLLEGLSDSVHLKTSLLARYLNFAKVLLKCNKFSVRFLAQLTINDNSTVMGRTINYITSQCNIPKCNLLSLTSSQVKSTLKYMKVDPRNEWVLHMSKELMEAKRPNDESTIPGFSQHEIETMLNYLCTS